jgi:hypothetical protein
MKREKYVLIGLISALSIMTSVVITFALRSDDHLEKERLDSIFEHAAELQTGFCFNYKGNLFCMKYIKSEEEFVNCITSPSKAECLTESDIVKFARVE